MLEKLLSKETCKNCKFCCSFRKKSLWETPLFSKEQKKTLQEKYQFAKFKNISENVFTIDLDNSYKTKNPEEESSCYFLNKNKGCILTNEEKPFDCSIWPFRLMKYKENLVIALTPTCPAINKIKIEKIRDYILESLGKKIFEYGKKHPFIIKEYKLDFPIIIEEKDL